MHLRFPPETKSVSAIPKDDLSEIINNLKMLKVNDDCIKRIIDAVNKMPGKDHVKGALKFFTQITAQKSKREDYYKHSQFIAEFFCTLSNLGMFAVAFYFQDFVILAAATFSALSHAIPSQRLHDLDILGVLMVFGKVISQYKVLMERPDVLAWGAGAMTVNVMDTIITRAHLDKIGPSLHTVWHCAAALALYKFNQAKVEVTGEELNSIFSKMVPDFLQTSYNAISEIVSNFSVRSSCGIC